MKKIEIDFHFYNLEDAIRVVESIINEARMEQKKIDCIFITGKGKIRSSLLSFLREEYDLNPIVPIINQGMILVDIS
jgi:dsDNA-specific endonuclease/ATPase MutS2